MSFSRLKLNCTLHWAESLLEKWAALLQWGPWLVSQGEHCKSNLFLLCSSVRWFISYPAHTPASFPYSCCPFFSAIFKPLFCLWISPSFLFLTIPSCSQLSGKFIGQTEFHSYGIVRNINYTIPISTYLQDLNK